MPILLTSSNTSPKLTASPNSAVWASLATATTSKMANNTNKITEMIEANPSPANRLFNPAPIVPVTIAITNVMTNGIMK